MDGGLFIRCFFRLVLGGGTGAFSSSDCSGRVCCVGIATSAGVSGAGGLLLNPETSARRGEGNCAVELEVSSMASEVEASSTVLMGFEVSSEGLGRLDGTVDSQTGVSFVVCSVEWTCSSVGLGMGNIVLYGLNFMKRGYTRS